MLCSKVQNGGLLLWRQSARVGRCDCLGGHAHTDHADHLPCPLEIVAFVAVCLENKLRNSF
jgi:hypothetical protein